MVSHQNNQRPSGWIFTRIIRDTMDGVTPESSDTMDGVSKVSSVDGVSKESSDIKWIGSCQNNLRSSE